MLKLCTHDGMLHADEVIASAILLESTSSQPCQIIRTRDQSKIDSSDIVYDVGLIYRPELNRFDHHQDGAPVRPCGTPYAAAGLIWDHFGKELCSQSSWSTIAAEILKVDALDNGIPANSQLPKLVEYFNPAFNESRSTDSLFMDGVSIMHVCLRESIQKGVSIESVFSEQLGVKDRKQVSENAKILGLEIVKDVFDKGDNMAVLPYSGLPWKDLVASNPHVQYVIFPSTNKFMIQSVPSPQSELTPLYPFPKDWSLNISNCWVDSAVFSHKAGFIAGAKTIAGCKAMGELALLLQQDVSMS